MKLFVHTGIFGASKDPLPTWVKSAQKMVTDIGEKAWTSLKNNSSALEVAVLAVKLCEAERTTNAGLGSKLQADGHARMTASISSASNNSKPLFSAVAGVEKVEHPIDVALRLHTKKNCSDRILAGEQTTVFARNEGFPSFNPITPERLDAWHQQNEVRSETVGAIAIDSQGNIACAASTGGVGGEIPGRVGDVASPAGCYTDGTAGIVFSGDGQKIVDNGGAAYLLGLLKSSGDEAVIEELKHWDNFTYGLAILRKNGSAIVQHNAAIFNSFYKKV